MAKYKKQVAKFKIYNLLEKNQLVLFYHHNNTISKDWHIIKEQLVNLGQITSMLAKNKIAQKVVSFLRFPDPRRGLRRINTTFDDEFSHALFQGPTILLGCSNLDILEELLRVLNKEKGFFLLGGFYKQRVVSCREIEKLGQLKAEGELYSKFVNTIKESPLRKLISIRNNLYLSCILEPQYRLLKLLKIRCIQLSTPKEKLGDKIY